MKPQEAIRSKRAEPVYEDLEREMTDAAIAFADEMRALVDAAWPDVEIGT